MEFEKAQRLVFENKVSKGFNRTDVPLELCLLQGEIAELFDAWRSRSSHIGEELADVAIYVLGLASILGLDLQGEVERKIAINAERLYDHSNGHPVRISQY